MHTVFVFQNVFQTNLLSTRVFGTGTPYDRARIGSMEEMPMNEWSYYFICFAISLWIELQKS